MLCDVPYLVTSCILVCFNDAVTFIYIQELEFTQFFPKKRGSFQLIQAKRNSDNIFCSSALKKKS